MTPQQRLFVDEYLVDLHATQAAIRAGYSPRTAGQIGHRLTRHPSVSAAIAVAMAQRSRRTGISADRVLRELARIAFADIRDTVTWGPAGIALVDSADLDPDVAAAVAEVSETVAGQARTKRVKLADKLSALRLLAAHTGVGLAGEGGTEDIGADQDPPVAEA